MIISRSVPHRGFTSVERCLIGVVLGSWSLLRHAHEAEPSSCCSMALFAVSRWPGAFSGAIDGESVPRKSTMSSTTWFIVLLDLGTVVPLSVATTDFGLAVRWPGGPRRRSTASRAGSPSCRRRLQRWRWSRSSAMTTTPTRATHGRPGRRHHRLRRPRAGPVAAALPAAGSGSGRAGRSTETTLVDWSSRSRSRHFVVQAGRLGSDGRPRPAGTPHAWALRTSPTGLRRWTPFAHILVIVCLDDEDGRMPEVQRRRHDHAGITHRPGCSCIETDEHAQRGAVASGVRRPNGPHAAKCRAPAGGRWPAWWPAAWARRPVPARDGRRWPGCCGHHPAANGLRDQPTR